MSIGSKGDSYSMNLGKILGNLQALEFLFRAFLVNEEIKLLSSFPQVKYLDKLKEGDIVPLNAFTNQDYLSTLIQKYNNNPKIKSSGLSIDKTLKDTRNAIIHGRVSSRELQGKLRLLQFGKPKDDQVTVTSSILITDKWLSEQVERIKSALLSVAEAQERLQIAS